MTALEQRRIQKTEKIQEAFVKQITLLRDWLTKKADKAVIGEEVKTCQNGLTLINAKYDMLKAGFDEYVKLCDNR